MSTRRHRRPRAILRAIRVSLETFVLAKVRKHSSEEMMGERLARLRQEKGLTQDEIADRLDVTQPVVSDYERGRLRLHGELIVQLCQILDVSADELLGIKAAARRNGAAKNRRLLRQVQAIEKLSKRDQQAVIRTIEAFISKAR